MAFERTKALVFQDSYNPNKTFMEVYGDLTDNKNIFSKKTGMSKMFCEKEVHMKMTVATLFQTTPVPAFVLQVLAQVLSMDISCRHLH